MMKFVTTHRNRGKKECREKHIRTEFENPMNAFLMGIFQIVAICTIEGVNIVNLWSLTNMYDLVFDFVAFYIVAEFSTYFSAVYDTGRFKVFADMQLNPHTFRSAKIIVDADQTELHAEFEKTSKEHKKKHDKKQEYGATRIEVIRRFT